MPLSEIAIRNAKPRTKAYKLSDGEGMYLRVAPSGGKWWQLKYRFGGKEKLLSFGVYPETTLAMARERRWEARKQLAEGIDPGEHKKHIRRIAILNSENSFEAIAREWHGIRKSGWTPRYAGLVLRRMELDLFPALGHRPIKEIGAPELLGVLRDIEKRGVGEIVHRALQTSGKVFLYAIATGRADRNPASDLSGALKTAVTSNHAHLKEKELPAFLRALEAYSGNAQTKLAVKLLLLTFVRTNELRAAEWNEFDLKDAIWRIPAERMKMRRPHMVPLSRQAVAALKELRQINGGKYLFPNLSRRKHPIMSENAILFVLKDLGYQGRATGHGFRHTASTVLNERGFNHDHIERQLAHVPANKIRGVYNHAEYLPQRKKMMQWWADYIDGMQ